jgi:hypothetical protein
MVESTSKAEGSSWKRVRNCLRRAWIVRASVSILLAFPMLSIAAEPSVAQEKLPQCTADRRGTLELVQGQPTNKPFGKSRGPRALVLKLKVKNCALIIPGEHLLVEADTLSREDGVTIPEYSVVEKGQSGQEPAQCLVPPPPDEGTTPVEPQICLTSRVRPNGQTAFVEFWVHPRGVAPGIYSTNIDIEHDFIEPFSTPASITLQYRHWIRLGFSMLFPMALGTLLVAAGSSQSLWGRRWRSVAKFVFATGAVAGVVYATYWQDPAWGSDGTQWFTLAGAALTAYMASLTTGLAAEGAIEIASLKKAATKQPKEARGAADLPKGP